MATTSAELINAYDVPLRRMLTYRLARLNAQLNAQAARILRESSGLSQTQWRVLVMIDSLGPLSPNHRRQGDCDGREEGNKRRDDEEGADIDSERNSDRCGRSSGSNDKRDHDPTG